MAKTRADSVVSSLLGVLLAIPYICLAGILAMRVDAGVFGVDVDLLNRPTGVQEPGMQWPSMVGLAVVSLLALILVTQTRKNWTARGRAWFGMGFASVVLVTVAYAVFVTGPDFVFGLQRFDMVEGPHSWVDRAGNSASVQLALAVVIAWSISQWRQREPAPTETSSTTPATQAGQLPVDPAAGYQIN